MCLPLAVRRDMGSHPKSISYFKHRNFTIPSQKLPNASETERVPPAASETERASLAASKTESPPQIVSETAVEPQEI